VSAELHVVGPYVEFEPSYQDRAHFAEEAFKLSDKLLRHAKLLVKSHHDAEDLVGETYHNAIRSWRTFRPEADLHKWLVSILTNLDIDRRRRQKREPSILPIRETDSPIFNVLPPSDVLDALAALPDDLQNAVSLIDAENYTYAEAAQKLGIPIDTLKWRLRKGRRTLRLALAHSTIRI
jgi:RNA polymerase sigma-70 factor, ECF subfamily